MFGFYREFRNKHIRFFKIGVGLLVGIEKLNDPLHTEALM